MKATKTATGMRLTCSTLEIEVIRAAVNKEHAKWSQDAEALKHKRTLGTLSPQESLALDLIECRVHHLMEVLSALVAPVLLAEYNKTWKGKGAKP